MELNEIGVILLVAWIFIIAFVLREENQSDSVKDDFQSYQNPYNQPSLSQKKTFSLGLSRLVDTATLKEDFQGLKEGFQSYQNPYTAASLEQSKEFRLGKRGLVDEVSAFMR